MNEILGARIRELRTAKGLVQEQVAGKIGMSRQRYARIENGTNNITLEDLSGIASALDVEIGDITRVLDEEPAIEYRVGGENSSSKTIFDMLDLFYANKHLYNRLQGEDGLEEE